MSGTRAGSMSGATLQMLPPGQAWFDPKTGNPTPEAWQFFFSLFARTGGTSAPVSATNPGQIGLSAVAAQAAQAETLATEAQSLGLMDFFRVQDAAQVQSISGGDDALALALVPQDVQQSGDGNLITNLGTVTTAQPSDRIGMSVGGADESMSVANFGNMMAAIISNPQPTQLPVTSIYQRSSMTGGAFNLGAGSVSWTLSLAIGVATLQFRLRDAANPTTVLQDWATAKTNALAGLQTVAISIPASEHWYLIDWQVNNYSGSIVQGTQEFAVGEVVAVYGQSLAVDAITQYFADASTTVASLGLSPSQFASEFATWADNNGTLYNNSGSNNTPASWQPPAGGTVFNSGFATELTNKLIAALGVPCAVIGHARGGAQIAILSPGQPDNLQFKAVASAAGGKFGTLIYIQGHQDATTAYFSSQSVYYSALVALISDLTSTFGSFKTLLCSIPSITQSAYAPSANIVAIRAAHLQYVAANSTTAAYVAGLDATLADGLHPSQAGNVTFANHFARAALMMLGVTTDGDLGPVVTGGTRGTVAQGTSGTISLTVQQTLPGSGLVAIPDWATAADQFQVFNSGGTTVPYGVSASSSASATQLSLTISSPPADSQALDVWYRLPPDASSTVVSAGIYDNNTADGGALGRQLRLLSGAITVPAPGSGSTGGPALASGTTPTLSLDASAASVLTSDTAFASPQTTNGGTVQGWKDSSGVGGFNFTQAAVANAPKLATNSQNGKSGVAFSSAASDVMTEASNVLAGTLQTTSFTMLLVGMTSNAANIVNIMAGMWNSANTAQNASNVFYIDQTTSALNAARNYGSNLTASIAETAKSKLFKILVRVNYSTNIITLSVNNDADASVTFTPASGLAVWDRFGLGKVAGWFGDCTIYECDVWEAVATGAGGATPTGDIATLLTYATNKWGS